MIRIKIKDKELILNNNTVIKYSMIFPSPLNDNMPSSVVQWFNIPAIEHNNTILNYAKFIEVKNKIRIYDNVIIMFGGISQKGKMIVKSVTDNSYKVSFTFNLIQKSFKEKKLNELEYVNYSLGTSGDSDTIIANAKSWSQLPYPLSDFAFPQIYATEFYSEDINSNFKNILNRYSSSIAEYQKNYSVSQYIYNINALSPQFYLLSILEFVMNNANLNVIGDFLDNDKIKKLLIFNNTAIDWVRRDKYTVKATTIPGNEYHFTPTGNTNAEYIEGYHVNFDNSIDSDNVFVDAPNLYDINIVSNYRIEADFWIRVQEPASYDEVRFEFFLVKNGNDYPPFYYDHFIITDFGNWNNYITEIDLTDFAVGDNVELHIRVSNSYGGGQYLEQIEFDYKDAIYTINPTSYNNVNLFSGDIITKNHVPRISASEFINNIVKLFSLAVFFDSDKVSFELLDDILKSDKLLDLTDYYILNSEEVQIYNDEYTVKMQLADNAKIKSIEEYTFLGSVYSNDLPSPTEANQLYYIIDTNKYMLSYFNDTYFTYHWMPYSDDFKNINEGISGAKIIESKISTLPNRNEKDTPTDFIPKYAMPETDKPGTSLALGTGINDFSFQLINYLGFINYLGSRYKPVASNTHYDENGNNYDALSIKLNGDDGIFGTFSKRYYDYLQERELVKFKLNIEEKQLHEIMQLFEPDSNTRKIRIKNRNYLPVQIDVEIGMDGIVNTLATLR